MNCHIKLSNPDQTLIWRGLVNETQYQEIMVKSCKKVVDSVDCILFPARTYSLEIFCKDFFLPTTTQNYFRICKIKNIALKNIAFVGSIILDICTLGIRIFTFIPRIIYNANKSEDPLLKFLTKEGVQDKINSDHINLTCLKINGRIYSKNSQDFFDYEKKIITQPINFIDLPFYESSSCSSETSFGPLLLSDLQKSLTDIGLTKSEGEEIIKSNFIIE